MPGSLSPAIPLTASLGDGLDVVGVSAAVTAVDAPAVVITAQRAGIYIQSVRRPLAHTTSC